MKAPAKELATRLALATTVVSLSIACLVPAAWSQTNPAAQTLPYSQDFSALSAASTTYPSGWQGWALAAGSPGAAFRTTAPTGDRALTVGTASSSAANAYNYNGKVGFLVSGSLDAAMCLALDTSGRTSVNVGYDVMTIRNPYDGGANTKINEVILQYRVGTSGAFTNLTGTEYSNNTTTQTTAVTTPQNVQARLAVLPPACDNEPVVQVRWASREVSGGGSRPSFAFDNVVVTGTGPHALTVNAVNGTVGKVPDQPTYLHNTIVALTATPSPGYVFANWSGDASGSTNPLNVTMDAPKSITANFQQLSTVSGGTPSGKITLASPNVTVPVVISRPSGSPPVFGYSVIFRANSPLVLPAGRFSITLPLGGGFLNADGGRNVVLQTIDQGGGVYKADGVTLGLPCGSSALNGTLFNVEVTSAALGGSATIEILSVTLRDCTNATIASFAGAPATVVINRTAPTVAVTSPNGAESLVMGTSQNVTWTATDPEGVATVDLAYSLDGGTTYPHVIATGIANSGSHAWLVPTTLTAIARVRVTAHDIDGNQAADASDANFSIVCPTITVTDVTTHVACNGGTNGAIDISVSGGAPPYGYLWNDAVTTQDRTGLAAGAYSVLVTDANGCTGNLNVTVNQPPLLVAGETHVNVLCFGAATGAIDVTASGGTPPYSYLWNDASTADDRSGLVAGTYSVIVTDANGCTANTGATITQPPVLAAGETHVNVSCFGGSNGSIDVAVSGGTPPYSYLWNDASTSEDRTGLSAGTYSVVVTDANGCTANTGATITQPPVLAAGETHVNVLCFGAATGSIDVSVSGGTPPYSYLWNDASTAEDRSGLVAGTYTVIVTDANGCIANTGATITQPPVLAAAETHANVLCFGAATGSIDVSVSGGTPPYSYLWNDASTAEDRTGLGAGTYSVIVTDANGCTANTGATITQPPVLAAAEKHVNVLCFGAAKGSIDVSVSGGTPPYSYLWNDAATAEDRTGLVAGTYSVVVTDANGCTANTGATITQPALLVAGETHTDACLTAADGTIDVTVSGGTPPYTYLWNDAVMTEDRTGLAAGSYSLTVTDANLCTTPLNVTVGLRSSTITATAGANGAISPSGPVAVTCGADQPFAITPALGYHVLDVVVDAVSQGPLTSWTFFDVQGIHTIAATFEINPPVAPVANLVATPVRTGNPAGSVTQIALTWTAVPLGTTVEVWRAPYGHYPQYDDAGGAEPAVVPSYPPGGPWVVTGVSTSGGLDLPTTRDFYYYVAYARDGFGTWSPASNRTSGTLNYHLGDVSDGITAGAGNNAVFTEDISLLGVHYGLSGVALAPFSYLDVGPTSTGYLDGRPLTDQETDFEDLVMFALNFNLVSAPGSIDASASVATGAEELRLEAPAQVATGSILAARLVLHGSKALRALATRLEWDPAVVEPVGHTAGEWLVLRGGVAFAPAPGAVDAAVFGAEGMDGEGALATVNFRAIAAGDPRIRIASADGRGAWNQAVAVSLPEVVAVPAIPRVTQLTACRPNPFLQRATIAFSLASPGAVQLAVFTVDGRRVRSLARDVREAGEYSVVWDGRDDHGVVVSAGVYYVRLVTAQGRFERTLVHLR